MNKLLLALVVVLGMFTNIPQPAHAQTSESIKEYAVDITVNRDSSILVQEQITYDFGAEQRHGIFRTIPYKYKARGGTFTLRISDVAVVNEKGEPYAFTSSRKGSDFELKIGDPDTTITGQHVYKISYTVNRAINYFPDHDELYWNAIGTGWAVPIEKTGVVVHVPTGSTNAQCYVGQEGSTETSCAILDNKKDTITYTYAKPLQPGEGFTIVAGLPAGTMAQPTTVQKVMDIVRDNGILLLPAFIFAIMFYLWRKYGRDAKGKGTIVAQYDPPQDLSPLYMGALVDGKVDNKDISAEIIYLAERGFLTITHIETTKLLWFKGSDYTLTKLKDIDDTLSKQGGALHRALFAGNKEIKLSEFKSNLKFGKALTAVRSKVFEELTKDGYYRSNPKTMQTSFIVAGCILGFLGSFILGNVIGYLGVIAAIASGLVVFGFGIIMPARTAKGAEAREYILGLKQYLSVAEADRLAFHNAPEKNPARFELLLPFAIALGVERLWAKQFEGIYTSQPSWYHGTASSNFNAVVLASSMNDFSGSVQSAVASSVSTASSGGSGFSGGGSGGGGGGGGGGSW